jgi:hypothetical protein
MVKQSGWEYILRGSVNQGLALLKERYAHERMPAAITSVGVAYLWLKRYAVAWEHFQNAIKTYPHTMDGFYKMAGVAKWCMNEPEIAIQQWQLGLRAQYTEGAGGVSSALLLFAASILRPEVIPRKDAKQFLMKKVQAKSAFARNWPSQLGKFVLGFIDEEALREACVGVNELDTHSRSWLAPFYEDILEFGDENIPQDELRRRMRRRADINLGELRERQKVLSILWKEEFFMARHMAYRRADHRQTPDSR